MAESTLCCGSAGIYNVTNPAESRRLQQRKLDNALATGAHAGTTVKVSDLNPASIEGQATFAQRADAASKEFCSVERSLTAVKACRAGARAELNEKFDVLRTAAIAQQKTFAAR